MKWKIRENSQELNIDGMSIMVHRWHSGGHKWFLTVKHTPFHLDRYPLLELDAEGARNEAVEILCNRSEAFQNSLQVISRRDKKKIQNFKLRLVAILNEAEKIQEFYDDANYPEPRIGDDIERLIGTIKTAMSDLD